MMNGAAGAARRTVHLASGVIHSEPFFAKDADLGSRANAAASRAGQTASVAGLVKSVGTVSAESHICSRAGSAAVRALFAGVFCRKVKAGIAGRAG